MDGWRGEGGTTDKTIIKYNILDWLELVSLFIDHRFSIVLFFSDSACLPHFDKVDNKNLIAQRVDVKLLTMAITESINCNFGLVVILLTAAASLFTWIKA